MRVFLHLGWFFKQEKRAYITGVLLLLVVAMLQLVPPRVIGLVVDAIQEGTLTKTALGQFVLILVATALSMYVFRYFWRKMIFGSSVKLTRQLRKKLYDHFTNMSQTFYQKYRTGDLMAHATNDLQIIQQTAGAGVLTLVDSVATGGIVIIAMATMISWKLTLISLIPMPFMALLIHLYGKQLHARFREAQEAFSGLNDKTQESITGVKVIKTFGQEKEEIASFRERSEEVVEKNVRVARVDALYDPTVSIIVSISFILALAFGAKFVLAGELTIGQLISFVAYLGLLVWPMLAFGYFFNIVERGRASYERIMKLLAEKSDIIDKLNAIKEQPTGEIKFAVDEFVYPGEKEARLKNIHFSVNRGETVGIVGKTGSGKTTLLKLLIREYDQYEGSISFGGVNIRGYQLSSLLGAIGYVPQEHFLFSATVGENIAFSHIDASAAEIEQAAKIAHVHEDIIQFSEGYDTVVGERGVSLSGGQQQRLSIARALLMNPEVLILDDSLSAVDAKTEEDILMSLKEERAEKTTFITAHRLSAIQHANIILVLDDGEIVQRGTHEQLMDETGWYREMFMRQQLEQLVEKGG